MDDSSSFIEFTGARGDWPQQLSPRTVGPDVVLQRIGGGDCDVDGNSCRVRPWTRARPHRGDSLDFAAGGIAASIARFRLRGGAGGSDDQALHHPAWNNFYS